MFQHGTLPTLDMLKVFLKMDNTLFQDIFTKSACYSKNCIVIPCDFSGPIKSFLATPTNTCLVSFPDSGTAHTTTEEGLDGLGTKLTAVYNVAI